AQITLPAELKAKPGRLVLLKADTPGKLVLWDKGDADLDLLPYQEPGTDAARCAIVVAPAPGRFRLVACTAVDGKPFLAACTLVVEGPTPPPPPPEPSDPFAQPVHAAWAADPSPDKGKHRETLAEIYAQVGDLARDPALATIGQLHERLRTVTARLLPDSALSAVREAVAAELRRALPTRPD